MDELTFFRILGDAVARYPNSPVNQGGYTIEPQPNTFAVGAVPTFLDADNFGITEQQLEKGFAYIRQGKTPIVVNFPAVVVFRYDGRYNLRTGRHTVDIEFIVRDKAPSFHDTQRILSPLEKRTDEEVFHDCQTIGLNILREVRNNYILAEVVPMPLGPATTYWGSKKMFKKLLADNLISSYRAIDNAESYFLTNSPETGRVLDNKRLDSRASHGNVVVPYVTFLAKFQMSFKECANTDFNTTIPDKPIINCCNGSN